MVTVSIDDQGYTGHILLEPNLSHSWRENKFFYLLITVVSMTIGGSFALMGGWLVLPFSGLELIVLGVSTYMFYRHYSYCEVITFTNDEVIIERGKSEPEQAYEYQRHWSQFYIKEHGLYDIPKVTIKSKGKETEIGSFLGYEEKMEFIGTLKRVTKAFVGSKAYHQKDN